MEIGSSLGGDSGSVVDLHEWQDLRELLKQWESGTLNGLPPSIPDQDKGRKTNQIHG